MTDWTWHGGGIDQARQQFGGWDWIDLSTGINPIPWTPSSDIRVDWSRLPEKGQLAALEGAAAEYFGIDSQYVCAVPGTEIGLRLTGQLIGGAADYLAPSYRTHREMVEHTSPTATPDSARLDRTLILANPNNPTGETICRERLIVLAGKGAEIRWLLVDEAFADCDPAISVADLVSADRKLVVFRSFGKFFGLAGLRLGFVLGPPGLLSALRAVLGAWPVSAAAIAFGREAYRDTEWIAAARERLTAQAAALDAVLAEAGLAAHGRCPLFRLLQTDDAQILFERLARRGILSRPFDYNPRWLRLGLPADLHAMQRLRGALIDG